MDLFIRGSGREYRTRGGGANGQELEEQLLISVKYIGSISIVYVM